MPDKTEVTGLHRVSEGVLINKDNDAFYAYKKQKAAAKKLNSVQEELGILKNNIAEIKEMIKGLVK